MHQQDNQNLDQTDTRPHSDSSMKATNYSLDIQVKSEPDDEIECDDWMINSQRIEYDSSKNSHHSNVSYNETVFEVSCFEISRPSTSTSFYNNINDQQIESIPINVINKIPLDNVDNSCKNVPQEKSSNLKDNEYGFVKTSSASISQKQRPKTFEEQMKVLRAHSRAYFEKDILPTSEEIVQISMKANLEPKVVGKWFRNTLEKTLYQKHQIEKSSQSSTTSNLDKYECLSKVGTLSNSSRGLTTFDIERQHLQQQRNSQQDIVQQQNLIQQQDPIQQPLLQVQKAEETGQRLWQNDTQTNSYAPSTSMEGPSDIDEEYEADDDIDRSIHSYHTDMSDENLETKSLSDSLEFLYCLDNIRTNKMTKNVDNSIDSPLVLIPKKRVRTVLTPVQQSLLNMYFEHRSYPLHKDYAFLSQELSLPHNVIKLWFHNSRRKIRRALKNEKKNECLKENDNEQLPGSKVELHIESQIRSRIESQTASEIRSQIESQMRSQMGGDQMALRMNMEYWNPTTPQLASTTAGVQNQTWNLMSPNICSSSIKSNSTCEKCNIMFLDTDELVRHRRNHSLEVNNENFSTMADISAPQTGHSLSEDSSSCPDIDHRIASLRTSIATFIDAQNVSLSKNILQSSHTTIQNVSQKQCKANINHQRN